MQRFIKGYYRHKEFKDVFIEILKIQYQDYKRFKGRAMWYNLGFTGNPWILHGNEPIEISSDQNGNWIRYSLEDLIKLSKNRNN